MKPLLRAALAVLLLPFATWAQADRITLTNIVPDRLVEFYPPLTQAAATEATQGGNPLVRNAHAAIIVPEGFDPKKTWPVLIVNTSSGGSSIEALPAFADAALTVGWVVLAAEGPSNLPPRSDGYGWRGVMLRSTFDFLQKTWPAATNWPVACAGFSGGAKMSASLANVFAARGKRVIGVFLGGCNEDYLSPSYAPAYRPPETFKLTPVFLSSGTMDKTATPEQHQAVRASLESRGFLNVRLVPYEGGHQLEADHLKAALDWFQREAGAKRRSLDPPPELRLPPPPGPRVVPP